MHGMLLYKINSHVVNNKKCCLPENGPYQVTDGRRVGIMVVLIVIDSGRCHGIRGAVSIKPVDLFKVDVTKPFLFPVAESVMNGSVMVTMRRTEMTTKWMHN